MHRSRKGQQLPAEWLAILLNPTIHEGSPEIKKSLLHPKLIGYNSGQFQGGLPKLRTIPDLPHPVRLVLEGFDLTMRGSQTVPAAELVAERAYGFVLGIETVQALEPFVTARLYEWIEATFADVTASFGVIDE